MSEANLRRQILIWVGIGLIAGLMSGLFGVGGGTIIVPLLLLTGFDVRKASGTSLAAIVITALAGVISYLGWINWIAALLIVVGSVVGAQIGSHLLQRLPKHVIQWCFFGFILLVIVSLFIVVTSREARLEITWWMGIALAILGLITGTLAGLLGIGGGLIVVPALIVIFGASDLVAKGTSLAMMIPTAISGTIGNMRRKNVDLRAAAVIGLAACLTVTAGAWLAAWFDPFVANILFACFLGYVAFEMARKALASAREIQLSRRTTQ